MSACRLTRLVMPALLAGMTATTLTGSDLYGWIAAGTTALILTAVPAVRRSSSAPRDVKELGGCPR